MTRESCEFLGDSETLKIFATQLWHMLDLLTHRMKCPLVYADAETVSPNDVLLSWCDFRHSRTLSNSGLKMRALKVVWPT